MSRQEWVNKLIYFQSRCRGYLVRRELKRVQAEYEDIVRELEGGVEHLSWRGHFIPKPHFTHTDPENGLFTYPQPKTQTQENCKGVEETKEQDETPYFQSEVLVPERDDDPCRGPDRESEETGAPPGSDTERKGMQRDSIAEMAAPDPQMDNSILQYTPPICTLLKDVTHTPEALMQHRNNLTMELLWIQQAIDSRKKYLTLKQKMEWS